MDEQNNEEFGKDEDFQEAMEAYRIADKLNNLAIILAAIAAVGTVLRIIITVIRSMA